MLEPDKVAYNFQKKGFKIGCGLFESKNGEGGSSTGIVIGEVKNIYEEPIAEVNVKLGSKTTMTNEQGWFTMEGLRLLSNLIQT